MRAVASRSNEFREVRVDGWMQGGRDNSLKLQPFPTFQLSTILELDLHWA